MISAQVAFILYAALLVFALIKLHGMPLWIALIIVLCLAVKTMVEIFRRRLDQ